MLTTRNFLPCAAGALLVGLTAGGCQESVSATPDTGPIKASAPKPGPDITPMPPGYAEQQRELKARIEAAKAHK